VACTELKQTDQSFKHRGYYNYHLVRIENSEIIQRKIFYVFYNFQRK